MSERESRSPEELRAELDRLAEAEDWDGCLRVLLLLEQRVPLTADDLVRKSALLQVASELGDLEEAERALEGALALAKNYVPALLDLGWFYYVVEDDAKTGLSYFLKAEELIRAQMEEASDGKEQCLEELQHKDVPS